VEVVYGQLRAAIVSGRLGQGSVLSQVQLAEQFGISRTPLREALRMLQSEGFIDSTPNQRVRVSTASISGLEQLYCMRLALEAVAIRVAVHRMTDEDLSHLRRLLDTMEKRRQDGDVEGWHASHREFHRGLVSHAGDSVMDVVGSLQDKADLYRHMFVTNEPIAWSATGPEHESIVEACERRDAAGAADRLVRHLARTALTGAALMEPEHDPVLIRTALATVLEPRAGVDLDVSARPVSNTAHAGPAAGR
jgi:DNA-binding GntR family transcriptional regulator